MKEPLHCRSWDTPFKASPPQSDSSLFSCHSSYESMTILGDVPGVQAFSAPGFTTPRFIEVSPHYIGLQSRKGPSRLFIRYVKETSRPAQSNMWESILQS